jgi:hypothetical protein
MEDQIVVRIDLISTLNVPPYPVATESLNRLPSTSVKVKSAAIGYVVVRTRSVEEAVVAIHSIVLDSGGDVVVCAGRCGEGKEASQIAVITDIPMATKTRALAALRLRQMFVGAKRFTPNG